MQQCPTDPLPCPTNAELVQPKLVAAVFLRLDENEIVLESGDNIQRYTLRKGFSLLEMDLASGQQQVRIYRQGKRILEGTGEQEVTSTPKDIWNYNLYVFRGQPC
jgi:hypothetical protein